MFSLPKKERVFSYNVKKTQLSKGTETLNTSNLNKELISMRERIFAIFTAKLYRALSKRDRGLGDLASNIIF